MLPNKMRISANATNSLRRLQSNTGLTVNIGARLAFFTSLEREYRFDPLSVAIQHDGRELDKHTWLGDYAAVSEHLLNQAYPNFTKQQFHNAWAAHIEDGLVYVASIRSLTTILNR